MTTSNALVPSPPQERTDYGVGASSAAAAIGVSDYRSRLDAWLEVTGRVASFTGNERTQWGQVLEPVIRAHYVERNRVTVHVPPESLFHRAHEFIRATPDGIVLKPGPFTSSTLFESTWAFVGPQVKNVGLRMAPAWADGVVPVDYLIQGVVEMAVADLPRIDFAVLIGGQQYEERTIWRDAELESEVVEELVGFWRLVQTNTQPEIDESRAFRSHVLAQIKRKAIVEASGATLADLERWREVAREIKKLKLEEGALKNRVIAEIAAANANKLTSPIGNVSIGSAPKRTVAWKAIAEKLRPLHFSVHQAERELEALRADIVAVAPEDVAAGWLQRIDMMRAQLRLVGATETFDGVVKQNTRFGDPSVTRPQAWTKDIRGGDDEDDHEEH